MDLRVKFLRPCSRWVTIKVNFWWFGHVLNQILDYLHGHWIPTQNTRGKMGEEKFKMLLNFAVDRPRLCGEARLRGNFFVVVMSVSLSLRDLEKFEQNNEWKHGYPFHHISLRPLSKYLCGLYTDFSVMDLSMDESKVAKMNVLPLQLSRSFEKRGRGVTPN